MQNQKTDLRYEIIMVDSSSDGTDKFVRENFPDVRVIHMENQTFTGKARNIGVEYALAGIVLFIDTDCIAPEDWIDKMYNAFRENNTEGICGALENGTPWSMTGSVGYYLEFFRFLPCAGKPYETLFLVGGNSGFRRPVFENTQFINANIGDDFTFSMDLKADKKKLVFFPTISVKHLNKKGFSRVLDYQYKLGVGACRYRRVLSPQIISVLEKIPLVTFLMPNIVMIWIATTILGKRGPLDFLKFLAFMPFAYVANINWARGFYKELKRGLSTSTLPHTANKSN